MRRKIQKKQSQNQNRKFKFVFLGFESQSSLAGMKNEKKNSVKVIRKRRGVCVCGWLMTLLANFNWEEEPDLVSNRITDFNGFGQFYWFLSQTGRYGLVFKALRLNTAMVWYRHTTIHKICIQIVSIVVVFCSIFLPQIFFFVKEKKKRL